MVLCMGCIAPVKPLMVLAVTIASAVAASSSVGHSTPQTIRESTGTCKDPRPPVTAQDTSASPEKYLATPESVSDTVFSRDQILSALYPYSAQPGPELIAQIS